jgi:hypothetical protein
MDPAVQAMADRVEAALALVCDPALRTAARRREGASTTRRLLFIATTGIETACAALPQGLLLRPAAIASLRAIMVDESASILESDLAIATCTCFLKAPSCLRQVRSRAWWCSCKEWGMRAATAAGTRLRWTADTAVPPRGATRPAHSLHVCDAARQPSGLHQPAPLAPADAPPPRWRTRVTPRLSCVWQRAAPAAARRSARRA